MHDYLLSVVFGVIEGLTEFLPVSSTAHIRIAQALFRVDLDDGFWKMYSVVIQLGAVLCLPVYFWRRIVKLLSAFPRGEDGSRNVITHPVSLTLIAFAVTAVPIVLGLTKLISQNLESLAVMGVALVVGGVVMWIVDALARSPRTLAVEQMSLGQAVWVGTMQVLSAVFPGTSRSMATIAGGQLAGMSRPAALEFSFFLSIPTMFAATLYDLYMTVWNRDAGELAPLDMSGHQWRVLGVGFAVSFIVALGVVAWFMGWVRKRGFVPFAVWRILLGVGVLIWALEAGGGS